MLRTRFRDVFILIGLLLSVGLGVAHVTPNNMQKKELESHRLELQRENLKSVSPLVLITKNIESNSSAFLEFKGKHLRSLKNVERGSESSKYVPLGVESKKVFEVPEGIKARFPFAPDINTDAASDECNKKLEELVLSYETISIAEAEFELHQDPEVACLYTYASNLNYSKIKQGTKTEYFNGVRAFFVELIDETQDVSILLSRFSYQGNKKAMLIRAEGESLILFDEQGGITIDLVSHDLSLHEPSIVTDGDCDYWQALLLCLLSNLDTILWNICRWPCGLFLSVPTPHTFVPCGVCLAGYVGFCAIQAAVEYCLFCDCNPFDDYIITGYILHEDNRPWAEIDVGISDYNWNVMGWYTGSDDDGYFHFNLGSYPGRIRVVFDRHCQDGQIVGTGDFSPSPGENDVGSWWAPNCTNVANCWLWVYHEDCSTPWANVEVHVTDLNDETGYDYCTTDQSGQCFLSFPPGTKRLLFDTGCACFLQYTDDIFSQGDNYLGVCLYECPVNINLEGRVVHENSGASWQGVIVYATDCSGYIIDQSTTNSSGKYYLDFGTQDFILVFDRGCCDGELYVTDCFVGLQGCDYEVSDVEFPECNANPITQAPSGCQATDDNCNQVCVSWNWSGSGQSGFKVIRNGNPVYTGTNPGERQWCDTQISGTYTYCVSAYNACGNRPSCCDQGTALPPPCEGCSISGNVSYGCDEIYPVSNVLISLSGGSSDTYNTQSDGSYNFENLECNLGYTVTPSKSEDLRDAITGSDALCVLRKLAFLDCPDYCEAAADVCQDGSVSGADALAILKYLAFLPDVCDVGQWIFDPGQITIPNLSQDMLNQDFIGFLLGDVNESWGGGLKASSQGAEFFVPEKVLSIESVRVISGKSVSVSVILDSGREVVHTVVFSLCYEPEFLQYESAALGKGMKGFMMVENGWEEGRVHVAMAGVEGVEGEDRTIVGINFRILDAEPGITSELSFVRALVDDCEVEKRGGTVELVSEILVEEEQQEALPGLESFRLFQNYPNPFNPQTTIRFIVPEVFDGGIEISIKVYNVQGQIAKELVEEIKHPGYYSVQWDGSDMQGKPMPTGVYLYTMTAGHFRETKKMIFMK